MSRQIYNKSVQIDAVKIFYREAGDKRNPGMLLLHGFPSSSVMFKNLMTALSDKYYLVAPDYPGFGFSDFQDPGSFTYTFNNISNHISRFTEEIGLRRFTIYLHDYGCPIGLRICIKQPGRINAIIVQDGNAYKEGIGPQWNETLDYWKHPTEEKKKKVYSFLSEEGIKKQYTEGLNEELLSRLSPEAWIIDWQRMSRPGNIEMQYLLNCDYQSNMKIYPEFQRYFREHQPPVLVLWGEKDEFFSVEEAYCYKNDLPNAQVHILNGGHKLLETNFDEVLSRIDQFMDSIKS